MRSRFSKYLFIANLLIVYLLTIQSLLFAAPGDLDLTFGGGDGIVTTALGTSDDNGYSVAIQSDGRILVAGDSWNGSNADFALVRYNTDGSLDTSFDGDGIVTTELGSSNDRGHGVVVQADGRILVAGSSYGSNDDFALVRYNADGSLDTSFDGDGMVTTAVGSGVDYGRSVALQSDGRILVAGYSNNGANDFALVRYNTDGSLDTSFGGDGIVTTELGISTDNGYSVAIQSDGRILVAGLSLIDGNFDFALVRYNTDGSLDTSFGVDGIVTTALGTSGDYGYSVAVQSDGRILVAGESYNGGNYDFALVRYNTDGSLDTSFGGDGIVTTALGTSNDNVHSMAVQSDGRILVAGESYNGGNYDFALVRYNTDGSLDTSFGGDGIVTTELGSTSDRSSSVAVQSDGQILVAGRSFIDGNYDFALVRYEGTPVNESTVTIDFEAPASSEPWYVPLNTILQEDGFDILVNNISYIWPPNYPTAQASYGPEALNGTQVILSNSGFDAYTFSRPNAGTFGFSGFEANEINLFHFDLDPDSTPGSEIYVEGEFADGSTQSHTFYTSSTYSSDFQTFVLNGWDSLTSLTISSNFSFMAYDNFVFTVPLDTDGDGIPDDQDNCPGGDDTVDTDGDTIPDFCDACPNDAANDGDGDGVCGDVDICPGGDDNVDSDGDTVPDACDICPAVTNPAQIDSDGDGIGDACDICPSDPDNDADADGVCGDVDNCPADSNPAQSDSDGDGIGDVCDTTIPTPGFTDDFESGTLENWIIGGRQEAGPNVAEVASRNGSLVAHLIKRSFTEIEFYRDFEFNSDFSFEFDMEVSAYSEYITPSFYSMAGAFFMFMDSNGNILGRVAYAAATSNYTSNNYASDPTKSYNPASVNIMSHYDLAVSDLLSQITIDQNLISKVRVVFNTYSSYGGLGWAQLWFDNFMVFNTVPTPDPVLLQSSQGSFLTIQSAYDSAPTGEGVTDMIKVKAGDQAPADIRFDRDVSIRLIGGYDDIFSTVLSDSEYFGTFTVGGQGDTTVTDVIVK